MAVSNKTYDTALAKLNAYIKKQGLRNSSVRNQVLEQICHLRQPFTAEELTQACEEDRISIATIYNALTLFVTAQIVHASKRQRGRTAIEYELITGSSNRLQVICTGCGRKATFHDKALEKMIVERQYYNLSMQHFSLFVYGECRLCRQKKKQEARKS